MKEREREREREREKEKEREREREGKRQQSTKVAPKSPNCSKRRGGGKGTRAVEEASLTPCLALSRVEFLTQGGLPGRTESQGAADAPTGSRAYPRAIYELKLFPPGRRGGDRISCDGVRGRLGSLEALVATDRNLHAADRLTGGHHRDQAVARVAQQLVPMRARVGRVLHADRVYANL